MLLNQGSARLRDLSVSIILAVVFSQFGLLVFLFTVPLYTLYYRKGLSDLLIAAGSVLFIITGFAFWKTGSVADTDLRQALIVTELLVPVLLMLGMFFVMDVIPGLSGYRKLYRLLFATGAAALIMVPVYQVLKDNSTFVEALSSQINSLTGLLSGGGAESYEAEVAATYFGEEGLIGYMKNFYLNSAGAFYFLLLLVSARAADLVLFRLSRHQPGREPLRLINFKVPEILLWPMLLLAVIMIVLLFDLFDLGFFVPIIWNSGLILLFLYGLQGLAILRYLFIRYGIPPGIRIMTEFLLLIVLVVPGVNYIVIIGLPVLGISETWINLRKPKRST